MEIVSGPGKMSAGGDAEYGVARGSGMHVKKKARSRASSDDEVSVACVSHFSAAARAHR